MTLPWIIAGAAAGLLAGPRIRAVVFARSTAPGQPPRSTCPACSAQFPPGRWRWLAVLPVTGRVPRLPDLLTATAFTGTLALLTAAALAAHQPGHLARAAIGAAALTGFYLALCLIRPGEMGLGDAKIAASIGV